MSGTNPSLAASCMYSLGSIPVGAGANRDTGRYNITVLLTKWW